MGVRMFQIRKAHERGHANHGWLDSWHTFSFADYHDPRHIHFRALRVMNEDQIAAGQGFGTHPHHDMEIVTYVLSGALEHRDSMGNGEVLRPGEFQRMTAGTGITHSEFNPSPTEPVHLYQIWLFPDRKGLTPSYEQKSFLPDQRKNQLCLVASPDAAGNALTIHADAKIYLVDLEPGRSIEQPLAPARSAWLQVLRGRVSVNDVALSAGDGLAVSAEPSLMMTADEPTEIMLFDLG